MARSTPSTWQAVWPRPLASFPAAASPISLGGTQPRRCDFLAHVAPTRTGRRRKPNPPPAFLLLSALRSYGTHLFPSRQCYTRATFPRKRRCKYMATAPFRIGFLVFPRITQLDLTGPYEVFAQMPGAELYLVWKTREPVRGSGDFVLTPCTTYAECPQFD